MDFSDFVSFTLETTISSLTINSESNFTIRFFSTSRDRRCAISELESIAISSSNFWYTCNNSIPSGVIDWIGSELTEQGISRSRCKSSSTTRASLYLNNSKEIWFTFRTTNFGAIHLSIGLTIGNCYEAGMILKRSFRVQVQVKGSYDMRNRSKILARFSFECKFLPLNAFHTMIWFILNVAVFYSFECFQGSNIFDTSQSIKFLSFKAYGAFLAIIIILERSVSAI